MPRLQESRGSASWLLEHSEATTASPEFVWRYWTDVAHWSDPPARFTLDGPFEAGARGTTELPGMEPVRWVLEEVEAGRSYTLGSALGGATLLCQWRFEPLLDGGTRLVQRFGVAGAEAERHAAGVRTGFEPTLAPGMKRIALLLAQAHTDAHTADGPTEASDD